MISIIISIISLIISLSSFIYNLICNKQWLKIDIVKSNFFLKPMLLVKLVISNKSRQPIKLLSVELNFDDEHFYSETFPIGISGDGYVINKTQVKVEKKSISLPYKFEAYDGIETYILFNTEYCKDYVGKATITFNTTRGKIKKKIEIVKEPSN